MKTIVKTCLGVIGASLVSFVSLPSAHAVVPPPDGGYPNFTTAEGSNALKNLTTGVGNTAAGWYSLFANTAGSLNTAVGAGTLLLNTGDSNTATGALSLLNNVAGNRNTANGYKALYSNDSGDENAAFGFGALRNNTTGFQNTANGAFALDSNTDGHANTANGYQALSYNESGYNNAAFGTATLASNTTGFQNTAIGMFALLSNTDGSFNTAVGNSALLLSSGSRNTALGYGAGSNLETGDSNIYIGKDVAGVTAESYRIRIGDNLPTGSGESACYIGGIAGQTVGAGGGTCYVDNAGKLGVFLSARRFKTDIADMNSASEALLRLRPVTFRYKPEMKATDAQQFGLIAEEVAEVNPNLVTRDGKGELSTVRYEAVNAMLLNEFLKEHRKNEEQQATITMLNSTDTKQAAIITQLKSTDAKQEATIARQQKQIEELTAQIQKVSAQLELSKSEPKTVLNK